MRIVHCLFLLLVMSVISLYAADSTEVKKETEAKTGYRIEQPGTITFTVGVKIKGKVEKPQVVIFLPKEKSQFRTMDFSYSFKNDIAKPLPFEPVIE